MAHGNYKANCRMRYVYIISLLDLWSRKYNAGPCNINSKQQELHNPLHPSTEMPLCTREYI
jgi:hypothetical protein